MADSIPSFSAEANIARVTAGFKKGPFFSNPNTAPEMVVVDTPEQAMIDKKLDQGPVHTAPIQDPWMDRRSK